MKTKFILILIVLISFKTLFGQKIDTLTHDPQALKILDKISQKYMFTPYRINFIYNFFSPADTTNFSFKGYIFVKKDKYKIIIPFSEIFTDGQKTYFYNKKTNELNIIPNEIDSNKVYTPKMLFEAYKSGYKYVIKGTATGNFPYKVNDKLTKKYFTTWVIDLYPEKPKTSDITIIRLWVDQKTNDLISAKFQYRDGVEELIQIIEQKDNVNISDAMFIFDRKNYPKNLQIINLNE